MQSLELDCGDGFLADIPEDAVHAGNSPDDPVPHRAEHGEGNLGNGGGDGVHGVDRADDLPDDAIGTQSDEAESEIADEAADPAQDHIAERAVRCTVLHDPAGQITCQRPQRNPDYPLNKHNDHPFVMGRLYTRDGCTGNIILPTRINCIPGMH